MPDLTFGREKGYGGDPDLPLRAQGRSPPPVNRFVGPEKKKPKQIWNQPDNSIFVVRAMPFPLRGAFVVPTLLTYLFTYNLLINCYYHYYTYVNNSGWLCQQLPALTCW